MKIPMFRSILFSALLCISIGQTMANGSELPLNAANSGYGNRKKSRSIESERIDDPIDVVMVAQANNTQQTQNILGACKLANGKTEISPTLDAGRYMYYFYGQNVSFIGATAKIIQPPKHGTLSLTEGTDPNNYFYDYTPDQLPAGTKDYFVVAVENNGVTVNIRYYIYIDILGTDEPSGIYYCGH